MINEFFIGITGAFIGFAGTITGTILYYDLQKKRELSQFYAWVDNTLDRFIKCVDNRPLPGLEQKNKKELEQVKITIKESQLHYYYFKIWPDIPNDIKVRNNKFNPQGTIIEFLRSHDYLDDIYNGNESETLMKWRDLHQWLLTEV